MISFVVSFQQKSDLNNFAEKSAVVIACDGVLMLICGEVSFSFVIYSV